MKRKNEIASYHKHIDNGGISVWVELSDNEYKNLSIHMMGDYYGYPAVESVLYDWGHMGAEDLEKIGLMFLEAANKEKARLSHA